MLRIRPGGPGRGNGPRTGRPRRGIALAALGMVTLVALVLAIATPDGAVGVDRADSGMGASLTDGVPAIDLSLAGGVSILGAREKDQLGNDLRLGDLNGDGIADLLLGAHWGSIGGRNIAGRAYGLHGRLEWSDIIDLERKPAADWWLMGVGREARLGSAVAVGDLSGDGIADLVVGSLLADPRDERPPHGEQTNAGAVYVVFGDERARHVDLQAPPPDGQPDLTFTGDSTSRAGSDQLGTDLTVGDFDGDGAFDLAAAAMLSGRQAGSVHVWFGPFGSGEIHNLRHVPADLTLEGHAERTYLGSSILAADVDADGIDDLLVGAFASSAPGIPVDSGAVHVLFGRRSRWSGTAAATDAADVSIYGPAGAALSGAFAAGLCSCRGRTLAVDDLTGDGVPDIAIGAPLMAGAADPADAVAGAARAGAVFLLPGPIEPGVINLATPPATGIRGDETEARFGWSLATGDLDGDGVVDLAVAAPHANPEGRAKAGAIHVFAGPLRTDGFTSVTEAASLVVHGAEAGHGDAGISIGVGDSDGDGLDDLHAGFPDAAPGGRRSVGVVRRASGPLFGGASPPTPGDQGGTGPTPPTATATATSGPRPTGGPTVTASSTARPSATGAPTGPGPRETPVPTARATAEASPSPRGTEASGPFDMYLPFAILLR